MKISNWLSALLLLCLLGWSTEAYAQDILIPGTGGSGEEKIDTKEEEEVPTENKTNTNTNTGNSGKSNSVKKGQSKKVDVKSGKSGTAGFDLSKFFVEPSGILNVYNGQTIIGAGCLVGYRISPRTEVALGPDLAYTNYVNVGSGSALGFRALARTMILEMVFAHAEYQTVRYNDSSRQDPYFQRRLPIGGGIRQRVGGNTFMNAMLLYDVLYDTGTGGAISPFIYNVSFSVGGIGGGTNRGIGRR